MLRAGSEQRSEGHVVDGFVAGVADLFGCVRRAADQQSRADVFRNPIRRQVGLPQVNTVSLRRQGQVESVVHDEEHVVSARDLPDLATPREHFTVQSLLGAKLHHRGAPCTGVFGLLRGIVLPARCRIGQYVQATQPVQGVGRQSRLGSSMPSSVIFLRRVFRLIPSMAAARIWLPSVRLSTVSSRGRSTRSSTFR